MTKAEQTHIEQIRELKQALKKTTSPRLIRDYQKAIKRKKNELRLYRNLYYFDSNY